MLFVNNASPPRYYPLGRVCRFMRISRVPFSVPSVGKLFFSVFSTWRVRPRDLRKKKERERERGHHCGITRTTEWKSVENWLGIPCWPGESFGRGREFYPPVLFDPRASACSFCDAKLKVSCLPRSWNEFDAFSDKLARLISRASLPRDYFDSMCSFFLSRLFCVRRRSFSNSHVLVKFWKLLYYS